MLVVVPLFTIFSKEKCAPSQTPMPILPSSQKAKSESGLACRQFVMKGDPGNRLERKENRIRGKAKTRVQFFSVFILKIKNAFFWRYNPYNIKFLHLKCIISQFLCQSCCFAESFHFHLRFKGFVNKISHSLYISNTNIYQKIIQLTVNIRTLKEKRSRNSRGYITKLGSDQHPDSNSAGKSCVTAYLESQFRKGPKHPIYGMAETFKTAVQGSCLSSQGAM